MRTLKRAGITCREMQMSLDVQAEVLPPHVVKTLEQTLLQVGAAISEYRTDLGQLATLENLSHEQQQMPTQETWARAGVRVSNAARSERRSLVADQDDLSLAHGTVPTQSVFTRIVSSISGRRSVVDPGGETPKPRVGIRPTWKPAPPQQPHPESHNEASDVPVSSRKAFFHIFGGM